MTEDQELKKADEGHDWWVVMLRTFCYLWGGGIVSKHPGPPLQGNEVISRTENALPGRGLPYSFPSPSSYALGSKLQNLPTLQNVLPENVLWIKLMLFLDIQDRRLESVFQNDYLKSEMLVLVSCLFTDLRREFPGWGWGGENFS